MGVKTGKPRGRPVGVQNRKIREIAEEARKAKITPLEAMLKVMERALEAGDDVMVLDAAGRAAPYIHPKPAAVHTVNGDEDGGPIRMVIKWADEDDEAP